MPPFYCRKSLLNKVYHKEKNYLNLLTIFFPWLFSVNPNVYNCKYTNVSIFINCFTAIWFFINTQNSIPSSIERCQNFRLFCLHRLLNRVACFDILYLYTIAGILIGWLIACLRRRVVQVCKLWCTVKEKIESFWPKKLSHLRN